MSEVRILIIDDDVVSQRALKNVLDSEGWRVRIVPLASHALGELASGGWNLVIVNVALTDLQGPVFAILRELALASSYSLSEEPEAEDAESEPDRGPVVPAEVKPPASPGVRVLFLVPALAARNVQPLLERDGLPYVPKPYHLHDFLEKVSDLLLEAGAIDTPIRSMREFVGSAKRRRRGAVKESKRGAMFASRDDYVMSDEEMAEFERQEEEDRKKRQKEQREREHLG